MLVRMILQGSAAALVIAGAAAVYSAAAQTEPAQNLAAQSLAARTAPDQTPSGTVADTGYRTAPAAGDDGYRRDGALQDGTGRDRHDDDDRHEHDHERRERR